MQNRSSKLKSPENKTSSGEIGLNIRAHASPKKGQDQVSGGVSVLCWHVAGLTFLMLDFVPHCIFLNL